MEPTHIHHEPCSRCGGKLVFKDTCESPKTGSPVHFFRCEDCATFNQDEPQKGIRLGTARSNYSV